MDLKNSLKRFWKCSYLAIVRTIEHDGVEHAGYMSFMVLFSLFPFLVFFLVMTSLLGASELGQNFVTLLADSLPENTGLMFKKRIEELTQVPPQSLMTLAIFGSIWTASSFVEGLRTILNRVYHISSPPTYITRRLMSILQFLIITFFLSLAMFLLVIIPIGLKKIPTLEMFFDYGGALIEYWRYVLIFLSLLITVSAFYFMIPNAKMKFSETLPGAFYTVILWMICGHFLSKYIVYYNQLSVVYGSLGSIIITMLFFYIINMLFIYGAVFNYLYHKAPEEAIEST